MYTYVKDQVLADTPIIFPQVSDLDSQSTLSEFFDPDDDVGLVDPDPSELKPYGFTWKFDFNANDLDFSVGGNPAKVRDLGTVNEWITHTINTEQFETPIFGSNIGTVINDLVGDIIDSYLITRVKDEIVDAVSIHDRISAVTFAIAFAVSTNIYGFLSYATDNEDGSSNLIQLR